MTAFNLVLLITKKNMELLQTTVPYIKKNIAAKKIYGIASNALKDEIENLGIRFLDEDKILDGLTFYTVKEAISKYNKNTDRTGWYFQQFLKYAFSYYSDTEYYLSWDSDTIPLNKLEYFTDNGTPFFVRKKEYHLPYFKVIEKLFNGEISRYDKKISFVAENMMFNTGYVKEIINFIENNNALQGERFFEKIIGATDTDTFDAGFSEFETYGNYMMLKHNSAYKLKKLRTLREGALFLGMHPSRKQLDWAAKDFDIISIESTNKKYNFSKYTLKKSQKNKGHLAPLVKFIMPLKYFRTFIKGGEVIIFD